MARARVSSTILVKGEQLQTSNHCQSEYFWWCFWKGWFSLDLTYRCPTFGILRKTFCWSITCTFGILDAKKTVSRFRWFEGPPLRADSDILPCYMVASCCPRIGWLISLSRAACNGSEHAHNMGLCRRHRTTSSAFTFVIFVSCILPLHGTLSREKSHVFSVLGYEAKMTKI